MDDDKLNPPPYKDLIGDILKTHTKEGGMDNLKGQGKPLSKEYFSGDTFQHFQRIAKDAGYKPHWLKLRHEIKDEIIAIAEINSIKTGQEEVTIRISKVNKKIMEYNKSCPPPLQKGQVSLENIETAATHW